MLLNPTHDMLQGNKDRVFKRLLGRNAPMTLFTTLNLGDPDPENGPLPVEERVYCSTQDLEPDPPLALPTSLGNKPAPKRILPDVCRPRPVGAYIPRPPPPQSSSIPGFPNPRTPSKTQSSYHSGGSVSTESNRTRKTSFIRSISRKGWSSKTHNERRTESFQDDESEEECYKSAEPEPTTSGNLEKRESSFDYDSSLEDVTYAETYSYNVEGYQDHNAKGQLEKESEKIKVKTLALCWWSEKFNRLTEVSDRITLDAVFWGRKEEVLATAILLSGGTILTPSLGSVEVGILFGLIYDIPELVRVNARWIKDHIKSSNIVDIFKIHKKVKEYGTCKEVTDAIRTFVRRDAAHVMPQVIELQDWVKVIGLDLIPVRILLEPLEKGTLKDPNRHCKLIKDAVSEELEKTDQELDKSSLFIKLISTEFRTFFDSLINYTTDLRVMRELFNVQQQLTQKIMSSIVSSNFRAMFGNMQAAIETDNTDDAEFFEEKKWRKFTARELFIAFLLKNMLSDTEGNDLIEFVVIEIVLDWIKFNKFNTPTEVCVTVLRYIQDLDKLSLQFVQAVVSEAHALLGPETFSCLNSSFSPLPQKFDYICQRFVLAKEDLELLLLEQHVTLKAECTLQSCSYAKTQSVVTVDLEQSSVTPILKLSYSIDQSNTEHKHYNFVHWCFTDSPSSVLQERVHLISVMTRSFTEIKHALSALDGCELLFFAKNSDYTLV